jgi:hypothetical protein
MKLIACFSLALLVASGAHAQSLPGADLLGKAKTAQSAAKLMGGNSAVSGMARDIAVKEATGSIKQKAGDYAKTKALDTAVKNPKLAGQAMGVAGKAGSVSKLKGVNVAQAKSTATNMAADRAKSKMRDAAASKLTGR